MAIQKEQVLTILRASTGPLTVAGIIALMHRQEGSRESLHNFAMLEHDSIMAALDQLVEDGSITVKFSSVSVYEVNA